MYLDRPLTQLKIFTTTLQTTYVHEVISGVIIDMPLP